MSVVSDQRECSLSKCPSPLRFPSDHQPMNIHQRLQQRFLQERKNQPKTMARIKLQRIILFFMFFFSRRPSSNAFQNNLVPLRCRGKVLNQNKLTPRFCVSSKLDVHTSPLFASPLPKKRSDIQRCMKFLSSIIISFFPSRACASISLPDSLVHFTVPWKRVIQAFVSLFLLSSGIFNHQVKKRQEKLATSEWARYAEHPSARGRAIMWLLTQQTVFLILSKVLWFRRRAIQEYAGKHFADSLLKLGPLYIKLGQIISCRKDMLGSEWIDAMATLQDKVPARTGQEAMDLAYSTLEGGKEEFDTLFSNFDPTPLAAASLGQVHKARLRKTGSEVAVKLQRPFLRQIYDQDLKFLTKIAKMMDNLPSSRKNVGGVSSSWTKIFQDAKIILYREIDYRYEARNAVRFSEDFGLGLGGRAAPTCNAKCKNDDFLPSAAEWIRTPYIFEDISNERLLVMEFVPSIKITDTVKLDAAKVTEEDKIELADALARAYLRQFCCNLFFSTDPHPGNLGVEIMENGTPRLVMYDFGQAATLTKDQADGILDIIEAIIDMNVNRSIDAFVKMGVLVDDADLDKVKVKVSENYRTGKIKANRKRLRRKGYVFRKEKPADISADITATTEIKDSEVMSFFTLPVEYAFVARALSQMDGVGKGLDPDFDFVSSAAPYIVEIKGAENYLKDEVKKFVASFFKNNPSWS